MLCAVLDVDLLTGDDVDGLRCALELLEWGKERYGYVYSVAITRMMAKVVTKRQARLTGVTSRGRTSLRCIDV